MILFALALLASSAADPVVAPASTPTPVATASAAKPVAAQPVDDLDKVVCHVDAETGTRLGNHKECHTKREWIQNQNDTANSLNRSTAH